MIKFKTNFETNKNTEFGIEIFKDDTRIKRLDNLSDDKASIEKLVSVCNDLQIEECHIDDIINDYLTDFSF